MDATRMKVLKDRLANMELELQQERIRLSQQQPTDDYDSLIRTMSFLSLTLRSLEDYSRKAQKIL